MIGSMDQGVEDSLINVVEGLWIILSLRVGYPPKSSQDCCVIGPLEPRGSSTKITLTHHIITINLRKYPPYLQSMTEKLPANLKGPHSIESRFVTFVNKETGVLETRDIITGELLVMEPPPAEETALNKMLDPLVQGALKAPQMHFSWETVGIIASLIAAGKSLPYICSLPGMPSMHLLNKWKMYEPRVRQMIDGAKETRGERLMEECLELADQISDEDDAKVKKVQIDVRMRMAQALAPNLLATSGKATGNVVAPVQIIVNTGINREAPLVDVHVNEAENIQEMKNSEMAQGAVGEEDGED